MVNALRPLWRVQVARRILIDFETTPDDLDLNFKIWIFAEDLYRALRSKELASLSLDDVDRVASRLVIPIRSKRKVRRVATVIEQLLDAHFLAQCATLSVTDESGQLVD
ncbi:hypothetical protein [Mesorhizobium loti]|uniref:hypothetical protein n=1 Tax=Rhizobium loti TaxID=381 RepID=UPI00053A8897|nr:hypothetical protein [Mesorhizobium loti]